MITVIEFSRLMNFAVIASGLLSVWAIFSSR